MIYLKLFKYWAILSSRKGHKEEPTASKTFAPDDWNNRFLPHVAKFLQHFTSNPRRQYHSLSRQVIEFHAQCAVAYF
jgi:hypothetical protein